MTTVVHRLDVDAAPETVFDHVVDLRTEPAWNPAARRVELRFASPQPWTLDADLYAPARQVALEASAPLRFVVP